MARLLPVAWASGAIPVFPGQPGTHTPLSNAGQGQGWRRCRSNATEDSGSPLARRAAGRIMFERNEMKTCPHCDTMMEEKAGLADEMLILPQQLADDQPPPLKVNRVRWSCPKCSHLEEGLPGAHAAWDKSDPLQT
jgi:hypothetical protein